MLEAVLTFRMMTDKFADVGGGIEYSDYDNNCDDESESAEYREELEQRLYRLAYSVPLLS